MKRLLLVCLALAAAFALIAATPASAKKPNPKPLNGEMELTLFGEFCGMPLKSPFLSWAGTVEFDGETYGIAYFPTSDPPEPGAKFFYFEENVTLFEIGEAAVTPALACNAGPLLAGDDEGRQGPGGTAKADGKVTFVDPDGPFADITPGSRFFWRGRVVMNDGVTQFPGRFHIRPLK